MSLSVWLLVFILVVKIKHVYVLTRCPESLSTVVRVARCPRNKAEWENQAKKKDCSKVSQSCVKPAEFLYHCLINEYMNMTIEVCAPSVPILGQKCAEFNTVGAIIQDNVHTKCDDSDPPCPFRYNSTDVYKYQRCYSYINSTSNTHVLPNCPDYIREKCICSSDQNVWLAISIVFITLFLISCGLAGIMLYKYRNLLHSTPGQEYEVHPLFSKGEDDTNVAPLNPEEKGTFKTDQKAVPENSRVYSIYFGDKHFGMAYFDPRYPKDVKSLGNHEIIGALVTNTGEVIEFGDQARKMFTENREDCRDYIFLDHHELDKEYWNDNISKLGSMKVKEVFQNIIGFLVKKILKDIADHGSQTQEESGLFNMHCVITVPHHWISHVVDLRIAFDRTMKDLNKDVQRDQLHIKSREVAISPYIHDVKAPVTCLIFKVDNLIFKDNTTYVNLHVGSKYCNLTFLRAVTSEKPDEIIGNPYIRKWRIHLTAEGRFEELFEDIFTRDIFHKWKTKYERDYISLLSLFEDRKNKMRENMDENEKYEFPLSSTLFELFQERRSGTTDLEDRVAKQKGEVKVENSGRTIIFKWSLLKTFFTHVKDSTKEIIREHKEQFEEQNVRCVIMTGSYSQMKLFMHEAENEWFNEFSSPVTVVIPVHIGSTYAMGAAYFFKKYPTWIFHDLINLK
ncbi:uncharacterized protein LOC134270109 [Saccostrea cucullata]|uniref:uncharacterized protein LOC134270109 n=1 Tax=Saccostrea cuccullata TaxID=36930 RepID=UPI002ED6374E